MKKSKGKRVGQWEGRLFLTPAVVILLLLTIFPFLFTLAMAFGKVTFAEGGLRISLVGVRPDFDKCFSRDSVRKGT